MSISIRKVAVAAGVVLSLAAVPVAFASGGSGGGGGANDPTVGTACTTIPTLAPRAGSLPKGLTGGAIWTTVVIQTCDPAVRVSAILGGRITGTVEPEPQLVATPSSLPRWQLPATSLTGAAAPKYSIDQEPVRYDTSYDIWVRTYNADTGELIETKTVTVRTPVGKGGGSLIIVP